MNKFVTAVHASHLGDPEVAASSIVNDLEFLGWSTDLDNSIILRIRIILDNFRLVLSFLDGIGSPIGIGRAKITSTRGDQGRFHFLEAEECITFPNEETVYVFMIGYFVHWDTADVL